MADLKGMYSQDDKPQADFEALPEGEYLAIIEASEMKATKAGDGHYLKLKLQVIEGKYKGRVVFDNLNLDNKSKTARDIARATFAVIREAVGVPNPQDSSELHGKPLVMKLKQREYNGEMQNEVKGYRATKPGAKLPEPVAAPKGDAYDDADHLPF